MKLRPSLEEVREYYTVLQENFDSAVEHEKASFRIDLSGYLHEHYKPNESKRRAIAGSGHLHDNLVEDIVRIAMRISTGVNIGLWGLIQVGKTPVQVVSSLIASCVMHLNSGQYVIPVFFTPNGESYHKQFVEKLGNLVKVLGEMRIYVDNPHESTVDNNGLSLSDYFEVLSDVIDETISNQIKKDLADHIVSEKVIDRVRQQSQYFTQNNHYVLPMSRKYSEFFKALVRCCRNNKHKMIINRDEAHVAIALDSTMDRMFGRRRPRQRS